MRIKLAIALATLPLLMLACGRSTTKASTKSAPPSNYFIKDMNVSLSVPSGWVEPKSWNVLKRKSYAARFDAPEGDASLMAGEAEFAGINCAAAAKEALQAVSGSRLEVANEFELKTSRDTLSAGAATTSTDKRQGVARYFCQAKSVVVVEAAANKAAFDKRRAELESILDSVKFDDGSQQVAIRPPAARPVQRFFQHTVRFRGQTLGQIAEWYTGAYDNWKKLARHNEDMSVPNVVLRTGRTIKIPIELVVRQDPLPEPKRSRAESKGASPTAKTGQKPVEPASPEEAPLVKEAPLPKEAPEPSAAMPQKEAPSTEPNPSEEEEAETTGVPKAVEEEAPALPAVIGPR